jgi:hypothetical protein
MLKSKNVLMLATFGSLLALGACQSTAGGSASGGASDMVVAKMSEGNVAEICKGGRSTITEASKAATTTLAKAGTISGDFDAIGKAAGSAFYKAKCG